MPRIHILGASGSGTTTLAIALAGKLRIPHFDSDNYFWISTVPPYRIKREKSSRDTRLNEDLRAFDEWIWSGAAERWNIDFERIELVVFLTIPSDLRLARLKAREMQERAELPFVTMEEQEQEICDFLEWARLYDGGGLEVRSRKVHESWLAKRTCPVLRIDGDTTTAERVRRVLDALTNSKEQAQA